MRLKQYLNEAAKEINIESVEEIAEIIKNDCQPFLKDWKSKYKKNFLYSGRWESYNFAKGKVRKDRKPRNTPKWIHEFIDNWFYKNFGVKSRSNSVFCTYNLEEAESYGDPYIVFPIGKYVMISGNIIDLYTELIEVNIEVKKIYNIKQIELREIEDDKELKDEFLSILEQKLENADYRKNKLHLVSEVMLTTNEYYLINEKYEEELRKLL